MPESMVVIEPQSALPLAIQILEKGGATQSVASTTGTGLWQTSMRGVDSHGLRLLPHYLAGLRGGRINGEPHFRLKKVRLSAGVLDADHAFGHAAGTEAMHHAIDFARATGVGAVSVKNSSHCGALAYFAQQACEQGMIGLAFTHASPKVQSFNARSVFFGTNPFCFCAPMADEGPYCFDSAPSIITF
ncbi:MAG TPA: Ldh family oxidoreductase, partial [Fibrobacteraceae bacterium]|nr:Ldh family oxidoreductase [Fibrobacteraceae bacterium]